MVLVDVSDKWTRSQLSPQVLQCLTHFSQVPSILVLNKVSAARLRTSLPSKVPSLSPCPLLLPHLQVDCLKQKSVLLELTAALTEGVVNGKKLSIKQALHSRLGAQSPSPAASGPDTHSVRASQRTGWPYFQEIFMLSALDHKDVNTLKVS